MRNEEFSCFGRMDSLSEEIFEEDCVDGKCQFYNECFEKTYDLTVEEYEREERMKEDPKLETFIERLESNKSHFLENEVAVLKDRKLIKLGTSSIGLTIPSVLNILYPLGSDVFSVWSNENQILLFFSQNSNADPDCAEILRELGKEKDKATFRSVCQSGKHHVLLLPQQFYKWFSTEKKVTPLYDEASSVLFIKSNLSAKELGDLKREKVLKSFEVRDSVEQIVSPKTREFEVQGMCSGCGSSGDLFISGSGKLLCCKCSESVEVENEGEDQVI